MLWDLPFVNPFPSQMLPPPSSLSTFVTVPTRMKLTKEDHFSSSWESLLLPRILRIRPPPPPLFDDETLARFFFYCRYRKKSCLGDQRGGWPSSRACLTRFLPVPLGFSFLEVPCACWRGAGSRKTAFIFAGRVPRQVRPQESWRVLGFTFSHPNPFLSPRIFLDACRSY